MPDQKAEPDWIESVELDNLLHMARGDIELNYGDTPQLDILKAFLRKKRGEDIEKAFTFVIDFIHHHDFDSITIKDLMDNYIKEQL